jgi:hypothetical protein
MAAGGGDRSRRETEVEEKMNLPVIAVFMWTTGRRGDDTRVELTMTRWSLDVAGAPGRRSKIAGVGREVAPCVWLNFEKIMKMPLPQFYKLLSIFLQKLKICKYKSCSIFKVLQLSQYEHFPNRLRF